MTSDYHTNPRRRDIKLGCDDSPINTIQKVIIAIQQGDKVVHANLPRCLSECYDNELSAAFRAIGYKDIRYGTMHHTLGGEGYTLYGEK